ncbi:MAG: prepilin-type N-terminal cleavage/methylation domain-containing protein [Myxococcota bacterium]|nr:prepilin-type N-terminal cleavage/methylation domain-containing protein [Myxococcota bacterium]
MNPIHRNRRGRRRAGFTLIELMVAAGIVSVLASVAIPSYMRLQLGTRLTEGKSNLGAIRTSEEAYRVQFGTYVAAAPAPGGPLGTNRRPWNAAAPGFDELGWLPEGSVFFDYVVTMAGGCPGAGACDRYTAEALGDLDGDTVLSAFGYVHAPVGSTVGLPGLICAGTGVFDPLSGAPDLLNAVGPCRVGDGTSLF